MPTNGLSARIVDSVSPLYGFMTLSPHASLSERSTIDCAASVRAEARLTAV